MLTIMKGFRKMAIVNDSSTLPVEPNARIIQACCPVNKIVEQDKFRLKKEKDMSESSRIATDVISADTFQTLVLSETPKPSAFDLYSSRASRCSGDWKKLGLNCEREAVKQSWWDSCVSRNKEAHQKQLEG